MNHKENLFAAFPPISKEEWLKKVEKDLKGRALTELNWHLNEEITVAPFYHSEDSEQQQFPIRGNQSANQWQIGEQILVEADLKNANAQALNALMNGVEALHFVLDRSLSKTDLSLLLKGIEVDFISTHFYVKNEFSAVLSLLENFHQFVLENKKDTATLKGSAQGQNDTQDWEAIKKSIAFAETNLPLFSLINIEDKTVGTSIAAGLAEMISDANEAIKVLMNLGLNASQASERIQFSIQLSCSYFVEIARIRSLKLLWANLLKAYEVVPSVPVISAQFRMDSQTENPHHNMIRATTQAMSAVLGGVDRLTVLPANESFENATEFTRRIARNVQHLLKMESHLDRVADPAAGSYYIEKLTTKFGTEAWKLIG